MNRKTLINGAIGGVLCWLTLLGTCQLAYAQPALDCQAAADLQPRYFANRGQFHWCVPMFQQGGWTHIHWQISRWGGPWESLEYTAGPELRMSAPLWERFRVRFAGCMGLGVPPLCTDPSPPSVEVVSGPDFDLDRSGVVSVLDYSRSCIQFGNRVVGRRLNQGEYK